MLSVGVLYSCQEFCEFSSRELISGAEFVSGGGRFVLSDPDVVLNFAVRMQWIRINADGNCELTEKGLSLVEQPNSDSRLRVQIEHFVETTQPAWSGRMRYGRAEASRHFPDAVRQVFQEAGLLDAWSDDLILWWDRIASGVNLEKARERLEIGRLAERRTVEYEKARTGRTPVWKCLDSDFVGYDVESTENDVKIYIEVKGSKRPINDAEFHVSRNEWKEAQSIRGYRFHIWLLRGCGRLFVVDPDQIAPHVPADNGDGHWSTFKISFSHFQSNEVPS